MDREIKVLAESIGNTHLSKLVLTHVKELVLKEAHLMIYIDNQGPLHEMESKEMDEHLRKALEKIYDPNITYELKLYNPNSRHEREKAMARFPQAIGKFFRDIMRSRK